MDHKFIYENGGYTLNIEDSTVERVDPFSWDIYKNSLIEINARGSLLKELPALPQLHRSRCARPTRDKKGKRVYKLYNSNEKYDGDPMFCIRKIDVSDTPIEKLPSLPLGLEELDIGFCSNLKELPSLPKTLKVLSMSWTNIEKIPSLPEGLTHLNVSGCPLKMLPFLPKSLLSLSVYDCQKMFLPRIITKIRNPFRRAIFYDDSYNEEYEPLEEYRERSNALWYTINHTRRMKQSLVAKAFHPSRVEKWLEVGGFELLEMVF